MMSGFKALPPPLQPFDAACVSVLQIGQTTQVPGRRGKFRPNGHIAGLAAPITTRPQIRHESLEPHTSIIDGVQFYSNFAPAALAVRTQVGDCLNYFFRGGA
jgi:hypothetical protein